jgi:gamma-glutamyltranspeptidase
VGERLGANSQILYNLIYHTLNPQTAIHTPRIDFSAVPIMVDGRLPNEVGSALARELGVQVQTAKPDLGKPQFASPVVIWGNSGSWSGGVDPYGMGIAVSE